MASIRVRRYLPIMAQDQQSFERRQADLTKVIYAMVMVACGALFFTHNIALAVACGGLAAAVLILWFVRRIRHAKGS